MAWWRFRFLVGVVLAVACLAWEAAGMTFQEALELAFTKYREGNLQEAYALTEIITSQSPNYAEAHNFMGVLEHGAGDPEAAIASYDRAIALSPNDTEFLNNKGFAVKALGRWPEAEAIFREVLKRDPDHAYAWNGLGLSYHYTGREKESLEAYDRALALRPEYAEARYNRGVSLATLGDVTTAAKDYFAAITIQPDLYGAVMNLASLHQEHGDPAMAAHYYERITNVTSMARDFLIMAHTNLGTLHYVDYAGEKADFHYRRASALYYEDLLALGVPEDRGRTLLTLGPDGMARALRGVPGVDAAAVPAIAKAVRELVDLKAHRSRLAVAICDWEAWEERAQSLVVETMAQYGLGNAGGPQPTCCIGFMPFDTLLLPVSNRVRMLVGLQHARRWSHDPVRFPLLQSPPLPVLPKQPGNQLRIGYLSYDFNDHPTAHMIEGLFKHHRRDRIDGTVYSYGKHDRSVFRNRIETELDHFVDMATWPHLRASERIRNDQVHILFDLQCFTRGNRAAIAAVRPAPIAVNMLIYPGTNGAPWLDYLVADRHVAPPEESRHYVEKLVYLPDTYQVNYYPVADFERGTTVDRASEPQGLREAYYVSQTPSPAPPKWATFVFANFNKVDKLGPGSWRTWMRVLKRVPGSVLWLLEPSERTKASDIEGRLRREAMACGVHPRRIVFAPRRSKRFHVARFEHADLFLDTFVYGAHSTATDALRGGLPVLTFQRENFASRVATSLLRNVDQPEMSARSVKRFEDLAVSLATRSRRALKRLKFSLSHEGMPEKYRARVKDRSVHDADQYLFADGSLPLFDIKRFTGNFERACRVMWDVYRSTPVEDPGKGIEVGKAVTMQLVIAPASVV